MEADHDRPSRMFNRVISRGSIKFVGRSVYQSNASLKPAAAKDIDLTSSNLFGVNLLEQQRLQVELDTKSEVISDGGVSGSDGNILCESVTGGAESSLAGPLVTQSPMTRKASELPPADN